MWQWDYHLHPFIVGETYFGVPVLDYEDYLKMNDEQYATLRQVAPSRGATTTFSKPLAIPSTRSTASPWNGSEASSIFRALTWRRSIRRCVPCGREKQIKAMST